MSRYFLILVILFFSVNAGAADIPPLINYQGMLTDAQGQPLPNGTHKLTFNLYDAATDGNLIWGPQVFQTVPVINGYFNVILGPVETDAAGSPLVDGDSILDAFDTEGRYLGIKVDAGEEITPRQQILSTPYAVTSARSSHHSNIVPLASIMPFAGNITTIPEGWLACDGSTVSRTDYANLYSIIGTSHGNGDGSNTFHLPDYRGRFLRGVDHGSGRDPDVAARVAPVDGGNTGNLVGSIQMDEYKSHNHGIRILDAQASNNGQPPSGGVNPTGTYYTNYSGGSETRPKNAYVNFIIKY